ncbi:DEHA2D05280p [Debaryomyces hansenii CBS767]|uniref:DEHA2D05280p n=1 Tax=Debaryomyces hansenii (strain ATCC 36239 / CBS 767 / BCRC 21394 / JCM 1990 / NBRC 0083 / IGC 2968) TaxID=284592 RepID=Q6BSX4_DEBHA|nr:DEHA2D05280p [Debaryomyces hansenii CBS767]CAG86835.1 DEHA2D05280p [Debaryomyces hansenii CBS767]|eukprot:XP_458696.1 DEHA2D05280p [Debaryomyces hansenii CBS767]
MMSIASLMNLAHRLAASAVVTAQFILKSEAIIISNPKFANLFLTENVSTQKISLMSIKANH